MSKQITLISTLHLYSEVNAIVEELDKLTQQIDQAENFAFKAARIVRVTKDDLTREHNPGYTSTRLRQAIKELETLGPSANNIIQHLVALLSRVSTKGSLVYTASDKILLVDFDDTIAEFNGPPPQLPGKPLPGVEKALTSLHSLGWKINIFSGRSNHEQGLAQIRNWMDQYKLPYDSIITGKPAYTVIVDNSAIPFNGDWSKILSSIKAEAAFTPSMVNAPKNPWGDTDVVIPTKPEWVDNEDTWYFPYKDRNVDWDSVFYILFHPGESNTKEASVRGSEDFKAWVRSDPKYYHLKKELKFPAIAFNNLDIEWISRSEKEQVVGYDSNAKIDIAKQTIYIADDLGDRETLDLVLLVFAKYVIWLKHKGILQTEAKLGTTAIQPNTTWRTNEPFEPLETNFVLDTNDENLWQQYSRQYKALRTNPYWSNFGEIMEFLTQNEKEEIEEKRSVLYRIIDLGKHYLLGRKQK